MIVNWDYKILETVLMSKKKPITLLFLSALLGLLVLCLTTGCGESPMGVLSHLKLPPGFKIELVASNVEGAKTIVFNEDGSTMWVSRGLFGIVSIFKDTNKDGKFDESASFVEGLKSPEGMVYRNGTLYIAEPHRVVVASDKNGDGIADDITSFIRGLPEGGMHKNRNMKFGPDGRLYIGIGSSCNLCEEEDPRRASFVSYDEHGHDMKVFASGIRNPAGFDWDPLTKKLWCSESSRDFFRFDFPYDEINMVERGGNYGWPYCFGSDKPDLEYDKTLSKNINKKLNISIDEYCKKTVNAKFLLEAKSKPRGLLFYNGNNFPKKYKNNMFIALNGLPKGRFPSGYKVVRAVIEKNKVVKVEDFITGWFKHTDDEEFDWQTSGSPYGLAVAPDGMLYVSDNEGGYIFRVYWDGK